MITSGGRKIISAVREAAAPYDIFDRSEQPLYSVSGDLVICYSRCSGKLRGLSIVEHTRFAGHFGHVAAVCRLVRAAAAATGETAAEQSQFRPDQCRGRDHRKPGLRCA